MEVKFTELDFHWKSPILSSEFAWKSSLLKSTSKKSLTYDISLNACYPTEKFLKLYCLVNFANYLKEIKLLLKVPSGNLAYFTGHCRLVKFPSQNFQHNLSRSIRSAIVCIKTLIPQSTSSIVCIKTLIPQSTSSFNLNQVGWFSETKVPSPIHHLAITQAEFLKDMSHMTPFQPQ